MAKGVEVEIKKERIRGPAPKTCKAYIEMEETDIEVRIGGIVSRWRTWAFEAFDGNELKVHVEDNFSTEESRVALFGPDHFVGGYPAFVARLARAAEEKLVEPDDKPTPPNSDLDLC